LTEWRQIAFFDSNIGEDGCVFTYIVRAGIIRAGIAIIALRGINAATCNGIMEAVSSDTVVIGAGVKVITVQSREYAGAEHALINGAKVCVIAKHRDVNTHALNA